MTWEWSGLGLVTAKLALGLFLLPLVGVSRVMAVEMFADQEVQGFAGEAVTLKCTFKSSAPISPKLIVNWLYRLPDGGTKESIFSYMSIEYPVKTGHFKDRIFWAGDVNKGDASIFIKNLTLKDNGTFSCHVTNPPDWHGNPALVVLTVTERAPSFQLSVVAFLAILVFIPSAIVVTLLLVRMGRKFRILGGNSKPHYKKSSIEDCPSHDTVPNRKSSVCEKTYHCCAVCLQDSDDEEQETEAVDYERAKLTSNFHVK